LAISSNETRFELKLKALVATVIRFWRFRRASATRARGGSESVGDIVAGPNFSDTLYLIGGASD